MDLDMSLLHDYAFPIIVGASVVLLVVGIAVDVYRKVLDKRKHGK